MRRPGLRVETASRDLTEALRGRGSRWRPAPRVGGLLFPGAGRPRCFPSLPRGWGYREGRGVTETRGWPTASRLAPLPGSVVRGA